MKITVVGGGNIGLVLTSVLSANTCNEIVLYSSHPDKIGKSILFYNHEKNQKEIVSNFFVTNNSETALKNADLILCTYPAFLRQKFIYENSQYIKEGALLGFVPGYGGIEYACQNLIKKGITIFGLQRVPYVARSTVDKNITTANIFSQKKSLYIAAIPRNKTLDICLLMEKLLNIPCIALKEYLAVTLVPSNPLLHTVGLYNVFKESTATSVFSNELHFYHEWNDSTSEILLKYDNEVQTICKALQPLNMEEVVSLAKYYESQTPGEMTKKLKSIPAFEEVMVPLKKSENGLVPELSSRMFTEDFPFGVCVIKDIALLAEVNTPTIDKILDFYKRIAGYVYFNSDGSHGKDYINTGAPGNYDIKTKEDLIYFYCKDNGGI